MSENEGGGGSLYMEKDDMQLLDGTRSWTCEVDEAYEKYTYANLIKISLGICIFLIIAVLAASADQLPAMLLVCVTVMLLAAGIGRWKMKSPGHIRMHYEMTDKYVHIGTGKGSTYLNFRDVEKMETEGNRITLHTSIFKVIHMRSMVYVPKKYFEEIKEYITERVRKEMKL